MPKCAVDTEEEKARLAKLAHLHVTLRRLGWPTLDAHNYAIRTFGKSLSGLNAVELKQVIDWALSEE